MQALIDQLTIKAGISEEQAIKALEAVKDFVKEKYPMMAGAVDNLLGQSIVPGTASKAGDNAKDNLTDMLH